MNELIIAAIISAGFGVMIAAYCTVAIVTEKVIKRSGKTLSQIFKEW